MNLYVASTINMSIGESVADSIGYLVAHTQDLMSTGKVYCDLNFYTSMASSNKNMDKFIPVTLNGDGTINTRVGSVTITLTAEEAMGADLPATIYNKVAQKLTTDYGWSVSVQA